MTDFPNRLWDYVSRGVEQLSVPQTAAIGGAGSGVSLATAAGTFDHSMVDAWLQTGALGLGLIGGVMSIGLMVMKFIQTRREMDTFMAKSLLDRDQLRKTDNRDRKALNARMDGIEAKVDAAE